VVSQEGRVRGRPLAGSEGAIAPGSYNRRSPPLRKRRRLDLAKATGEDPFALGMMEPLGHDAAGVFAFRLLAFIVGLAIGSFANVCIHRIPLRQSIARPASRCPRCGAAIRSFDNVPVMGWLWLRGACRSCQAPISIRYPLVELANALLYLALAWLRGPTLGAIVSMLLATALLVLSLIDLEHHLLPDVITLPGIVLGFAASFLPGSAVGPLESGLAAAGGYVAFLFVARAYQKARGMEGLGQGDWKMAAMLGAFLGWQQMLLVVFLASVVGTLIGLLLIAFRGRNMQFALPLGTFLGAAGIAVLFVGRPLVDWYSGFLRG
jgi:leader peptidase (prepilin peptidase)/N-methyltransferase